MGMVVDPVVWPGAPGSTPGVVLGVVETVRV